MRRGVNRRLVLVRKSRPRAEAGLVQLPVAVEPSQRVVAFIPNQETGRVSELGHPSGDENLTGPGGSAHRAR